MEHKLISRLIKGHECVAIARFGIYKSIAIMHLTPTLSSDKSNKVNIEGKYYYLKHRKKMDLRGTLDKQANSIELTEYFEDKPTGHFEFYLEDSASNYWSKINSAEKEIAILAHVCEGELPNGKPAISMKYYANKHKTSVYPEPDKLYDVVDKVWACKLPDDILAFKISVVGANHHLGSWNGLAQPSSVPGVYVHDTFDNGNRCYIVIELKNEESITFKDVDCGICCGNRASLHGQYTYKNSVKILGE
jgi:hypothetical protein